MAASELASTENRYRGCWVGTDLPATIEQFESDLQYSLSLWHNRRIKVVWLTVLPRYAHLISVAIACGFDFHHVRNTADNAVILTKRLIDDALIPEFANHTIGVGGIVLNDKDEVLTIIEKHDMVSRPGHLKFPGGSVDKGELLAHAVTREVFEETGINTMFNGVVGFRHYHKGQFGTSNIYFLCHLTAVSDAIEICPKEIGFAQWMPIDEYLACDTVIEFNKTMLRAALTNNYFKLNDIGEVVGVPPDEYEILTPTL
ncbi:MAG: NUDIX domain-containing protein [Gammaproteobacteria bacterium]|nr:NUDIX domain-containing protein [Gammaproteobacteria bacterium]